MATPRFFVEGVFQTGETLTLNGADAHKIVDVLRKRSGDQIEIIDSAAQQFTGRLDIAGRAVRAHLGERRASNTESSLDVTVAQGIPKGNKMDFVVEKLTELGAAAIIPLQSERTLPHAKRERWQRLAKSAAQQCGRTRIPDVQAPQTFDALLGTFASYDLVLLPWELAESKPLRDVFAETMKDAQKVLVIVGPEGGFSHAEAESAKNKGARILSLGPRILRTETAAMVAVALLNYAAGE